MIRKLKIGSAVSGFFLALAAVGLGWLPPLFNFEVNPILEFLRNDPTGNYLSRISLMIGAGLLLHNWLKLGRAIISGELILSRDLFIIGGLPYLFFLFAPPLFSRDVYSYMAQARLTLRGLSPYEYGVGWLPGWFQLGADPMWADSPTPYGALAIEIGTTIEKLIPNSPYWGMLSHRAVAYVGIGLTIYWLSQLAKQAGINVHMALWFSVFNPLAIFHFGSAAHNDALMMGLLLGSFAQASKRQRSRSLILLIAAAAIKPIALLAAPFVVLQFLRTYHTENLRLSTVFKAFTVSATFVVGTLFILGQVTGLGMGWISALATPTSVRTLLSPTTLLGEIIGRPLEFFNLVSTDTFVQILHLGGLTIALVALGYLTITHQRRLPLRSAAFAFGFVVLLSPVVQPWYLVWVFMLFAAAGINRTWKLQAMVFGTAFFVAYSAVDVNVVLDSALSASDLIAAFTAVFALAFVMWASPSERKLIFDPNFSGALVAKD